jgi:hypothetical protein
MPEDKFPKQPQYIKDPAEALRIKAVNFLETLEPTVNCLIKKAKGKEDLAEALQYLGELTYIATFRVNHALAKLHKHKSQEDK